MGTSERREREKLKRRNDILTAAQRLFWDRGLKNTTIDDIARATELARGTIYLYFESKEDIYATILMDGLDILGKMLMESQDSNVDPLENLLNGHDAYMQFHDQYPQYYNVMLLHKLEIATLIPESTKQLLNDKREAMAKWIASRLDAGVEQGMFRAMDTLQVAYLQMGMANGFACMIDGCGLCGTTEEREQLRLAMHDIIANGVMRRTSK